MSFDDGGAQASGAQTSQQYAEERVDVFLAATLKNAGLRDSDIDHVRDDLVSVYVTAIGDGTYEWLDSAMYDRLQWCAAQLQTERRRDTFAEILMYVGDPWDWMNRWTGFTPDQVGEDPYVLPAEAIHNGFGTGDSSDGSGGVEFGSAGYTTPEEQERTPDVGYEPFTDA